MAPASLILTGLASAAVAGLAAAALDGRAAGGPDRASVARALPGDSGARPVLPRKGDREAAPRPAPRANPVTSVEVVGVGEAVIILRDRHGFLVYRSDPVANVTLVARDADLPAVTVRRAAGSPVRETPVRGSSPGRAPDARDGRPPAGCEAAVSPLVDPGARSRPRLCLALAL